MTKLSDKKVVKIPSIMEREYSYKEICSNLENRKKSFDDSWKKWSTIEETWTNFLNRNDTFLTMNK